MNSQKFWDKKHGEYSDTHWVNKPSLFASWAAGFFPASGKVLELGCGQGQDTRYFAELGYKITALDYSNKGIELAKSKTQDKLRDKITFNIADFAQALNYPSDSFDIVYSHLAIHYFDKVGTEKLFLEIQRVLKKNGILAFIVNSTSDPECGTGEKKEEDYFEIKGVLKRFFSIESAKEFTNGFETLALDSNGETYEDRAIGTEQLIRYIGKKI